MPGYEIKRNENKFYFVLYPNNSNTQELGQSVEYNSEKECKKAIDKFKSIILLNQIRSLDSKYVKISEGGHMRIVDENNDEMFITRNTSKPKVNGNKTIDSIYRHINANIK